MELKNQSNGRDEMTKTWDSFESCFIFGDAASKCPSSSACEAKYGGQTLAHPTATPAEIAPREAGTGGSRSSCCIPEGHRQPIDRSIRRRLTTNKQHPIPQRGPRWVAVGSIFPFTKRVCLGLCFEALARPSIQKAS